jgi:predicted ATPase
LLILDNFEQLVDAGAPIVWTLLERIPALTCLLTSRQRLDLEGEQVFPVQSLPVPTVPGTPERLAEFPSVRLFVDRAQTARPDFQITRENAAAVSALCERLEGLPLAIELAAAWAAVLTPSQMLVRLEHRFAFLTSRRKNLAARHRTLRDTVEWSYRLLTPEMQRFFAQLSVFRGGWTLDAAEAVCEEPLALDYLQQLQGRSLVVTEEPGDQMRFRLLETLREYARDQLAEGGDDETVRRRHLDYFLALAETAGPKMQGPEQVATLAMLGTEHDNLRAALDYSKEEGVRERDEGSQTSSPIPRRASLGLRLAVALCSFWEVRGYLEEGRTWLAALLAGSGSAEVALRARALDAAGTLAWHQASYAQARSFFEESLSLFRQADDKQGIAGTLHGLGILAEEQGDYDAARTFLEESLAAKRELADRRGLAASLNSLANVVSDQGGYSAARSYLEESLSLLRDIGYRQGIAAVLHNLGNVARNQGDDVTARSLLEESLAIKRELGDKHGIALSLPCLGELAQAQGDNLTARALYNESLVILGDLADRRGTAVCLEEIAGLAAAQGEPMQAARLFGAAESLREAIDAPLPPIERAAHDGVVAALRSRLREEVFTAAWRDGRSMTLERAVEYALQDASR